MSGVTLWPEDLERISKFITGINQLVKDTGISFGEIDCLFLEAEELGRVEMQDGGVFAWTNKPKQA